MCTKEVSTEHCTFMYFDENNKEWESLYKFPTLSHFPSWLVLDDTLYAAGGREVFVDYKLMGKRLPYFEFDDIHFDDDYIDSGFMDFQLCDNIEPVYHQDFLCYTPEQNEWSSLPPLKKARCDFPLVHMDGFLYAIGGRNKENNYIREVERFDVAKQEWDNVAELPAFFSCVSATVYEGKILAYCVSSMNDSYSSAPFYTHVLLVYDPCTNTWQEKFSEDHRSKERVHIKPPIIFNHKGQFYRVMFAFENEDYGEFKDTLQTVHTLKIEGNVDTVTIEDEVNQDLIPANEEGAFRIQNEVFVNMNGLEYKTHLTDRSSAKGSS